MISKQHLLKLVSEYKKKPLPRFYSLRYYNEMLKKISFRLEKSLSKK